ncbi:MAG: ImmA/IrrE family metallo-endopeptidase [Armatimonadota bacterium]
MAVLKNLNIVFSNDILEQKAAELIRRYASQRHWVPSLPLPIDSIIEHTLDLYIEYDTIPEAIGTTVWGCIDPGRRTITLNSRHTEVFDNCPGLERFTLGHEVGHWIMHVDQSELLQHNMFEDSPEVLICRDGDDSIYERVADRFAAFLLMPRDLLLSELPKQDVNLRVGFRELAKRINVSYTALHFRLQKLGIPHNE